MDAISFFDDQLHPLGRMMVRPDVIVPAEDTRALEFVDADGAIVAPKQRRDGRLDPQTFRGVREITPTAAATFDRVRGEAA